MTTHSPMLPLAFNIPENVIIIIRDLCTGIEGQSCIAFPFLSYLIYPNNMASHCTTSPRIMCDKWRPSTCLHYKRICKSSSKGVIQYGHMNAFSWIILISFYSLQPQVAFRVSLTQLSKYIMLVMKHLLLELRGLNES